MKQNGKYNEKLTIFTLLQYNENIFYSTLYTIKLKICTQRFYYSSSKLYSTQVSSSSVASLRLFAKADVKNLSKVD